MKHIPSLNGLRAISILMVIFAHIAANDPKDFAFIKALPLYPKQIFYFFFDGAFGVTFFFIISGFLITLLLLREEEKFGTISIRKFYIRRFLRILPGMYFLLFVYGILQLCHIIEIDLMSWITALTYTKVFIKSSIYTEHLWSLCTEEWFYLLWPIIFLKLNKKYKSILLILVICTSPFIRIFAKTSTLPILSPLSFVTRSDAIAIGCLIAIWKDHILSHMSQLWNVYFIAALVILFYDKQLSDWARTFHLEVLFINDRYNFISNICTGVIILYSVYGPNNLWKKFLNLPWMNYLGLLCYSLYLWQQFFTYRRSDITLTHWPINFVCIFIAGIVSYHFVEKPFLKLKTKFST